MIGTMPADREQRVADCVRHGVAERRHLAPGLIADQAHRCGGSREPEMMPSVSASWKRNRYLAMTSRAPAALSSRARPTEQARALGLQAITEPGPAEMPTMAMKMLRPTEFMKQTVGVGNAPNDGRPSGASRQRCRRRAGARWTASAGTPATEDDRSEQRADYDERPTNAMSVTSVARSAAAERLTVLLVSCVRRRWSGCRRAAPWWSAGSG